MRAFLRVLNHVCVMMSINSKWCGRLASNIHCHIVIYAAFKAKRLPKYRKMRWAVFDFLPLYIEKQNFGIFLSLMCLL
jgi:hypothetical protein